MLNELLSLCDATIDRKTGRSRNNFYSNYLFVRTASNNARTKRANHELNLEEKREPKVHARLLEKSERERKKERERGGSRCLTI